MKIYTQLPVYWAHLAKTNVVLHNSPAKIIHTHMTHLEDRSLRPIRVSSSVFHRQGTMNVCTKRHDSPSNICSGVPIDQPSNTVIPTALS